MNPSVTREPSGKPMSGQSAGHGATPVHISVNTVREHVRSIYRKLDVTTKAEAVAVYLTKQSAT